MRKLVNNYITTSILWCLVAIGLYFWCYCVSDYQKLLTSHNWQTTSCLIKNIKHGRIYHGDIPEIPEVPLVGGLVNHFFGNIAIQYEYSVNNINYHGEQVLFPHDVGLLIPELEKPNHAISTVRYDPKAPEISLLAPAVSEHLRWLLLNGACLFGMGAGGLLLGRLLSSCD